MRCDRRLPEARQTESVPKTRYVCTTPVYVAVATFEMSEHSML